MSRKHFGKRLLVGVDETNHGGFPEIFVAVYSQFQRDVETMSQGKLKKQGLFGEFYPFDKRDFVYSIIERSHYEKYGHHNLIVNLIPKLTEQIGKRAPHFGSLSVFMDGELKTKQIKMIRDRVSEVMRRKTTVFEKPKREKNQQIYLINLADGVANYLFRNKSLEELTSSPLKERLVQFD